MLEIELKFRLENPAITKDKLRAMGGRFLVEQYEVDHYFNAPDRDFRATDEVFRMRCVDDAAVLTYKGAKLGGAVKTRPEIDVPLMAGPIAMRDIEKLILALGYRPTAIVRKTREMYELVRDGFALHICFDDLESVGQFVEIEIVAEETRLPAAEAVIQQLASELNLTTPEPRAYLRMVLEAKGIDR